MLSQKEQVSLEDPFPSRGPQQKTKRKKKSEKKSILDEEASDDSGAGLPTMNKKRLNQTLRLLNEDDSDNVDEDSGEEFESSKRASATMTSTPDGRVEVQEEEDLGDDSDIGDGEVINAGDIDPEAFQDEQVFSSFFSSKGPEQSGMTLGELLAPQLEKLERDAKRAKKQEQKAKAQKPAKPAERKERALSQEAIRIYEDIGKSLAIYKSGKLPKALTMVVKLENWEELLAFTKPDDWSPQAVYVITRLFSSGSNAKLAQRFYNIILLPRVREDIDQHKTLNYHLYQSLIRALFRPDAFFKGILLPLCESGDCTLVEAVIIGSVIKKRSIPVLYSCAAIEKITDLEYSGTNSYFLRILLDKKYNLANRTIQAVFHHFMRFVDEERQLPVVWFQAVLVFAQRYKNELTEEQISDLITLVTAHQKHYLMSPEIKKELLAADVMKKKLYEKGGAATLGIGAEGIMLDSAAPWVNELA